MLQISNEVNPNLSFLQKRIFKSTLRSPEIVLANNNFNWVNVLETEKPLLSLETAITQQPF